VIEVEKDIYLDKYITVPDSVSRSGGFSKVYKCLNRITAEFVAVKVMKVDNPLKRRFYEREVEAISKLNHQSIVRIIDHGLMDDDACIVLPWLETSLTTHLSNHDFSRKAIFNEILVPILDGLAYAHERQVFHRDISPRNILVSEEGRPLIADFGSAKVYSDGAFHETQLRTESLPYTPESGNVAEIDVYSFGAMAIELLSKEKAYSRDDLTEILKSSGKNKPGIAPETKIILEKCIDLDPERRYRSAVQLKEIFDKRALTIKKAETSKNSRARFYLSAKASNSLASSARGNSSVEAFVNSEIQSSSLYASPKRLDDGTYSRDEFLLIANTLKFYLKPHESKNCWVAAAAHLEDSDDLEYSREKGFSLDGIGILWECVKNPPSDVVSFSGFEAVYEKYAKWIKQGRPEREVTHLVESNAQEMLGRWGRILDAQQHIYSNRFKPLKFVDSQLENNRIYLKLENTVEFEIEDSYWKIPFSEKSAYGTIDYHDGVDVEIHLNRYGKGNIAKSGIISPEIEVGNEMQIKRQRDALQSVLDSSSINPKLANYLVSPNLIPKNTPLKVINWKSDIDESKQEAIQKALTNSGIMIIKGPPGTGKTSFIAEYIYQELLRSSTSQILLVSQTHVALDNALARLSDLGIEDVVRLGQPDDPRISKSSKRLLVDTQMLNWKERLKKDSTKYIERLAESVNLTMPQTQSLILLESMEAILAEINGLRETSDSSSDLYTRDGENISEFNKSKIQEKIDALETEKVNLTQELRALAPKVGITIPRDMHASFVIDFRDAIIGSDTRVTRVASIARVQQKWILKAGASTQVEPIFLHTRRVLAGTCLGFLSNRNVRDLNFDVCIIDEASKASTTESLVSMSKARRTVLVGDSSQLSPGEYELSSQEKKVIEEKFQLNENDFESSMISYLEESERLNDSQYASLDVQYRMRDAIGKMISELFYNGKLISRNHTRDDIHLDFVLKGVDWIDTGSSEPGKGREFRIGDSYSNKYEIDIIRDKIELLISAIGKWVKPESKLTVLVIAPYAAQVELARSNLNQYNSKILDIQFNTIDAVQGREADIVFFTTVRNNTQGKTGFLAKRNWRRINVALSRARLNVTIVGNASFWESTDSALKDVLDFIGKESQTNSEFRIEGVHTND
jgi:superfamily I DNA and/or RNA helicase/serine/threonine protein kinase